MNEFCKVKKVKRGYAYVELVKSEKCAGCNVCSFNNKKSIVAPAKCDIPVEVGQTVEIVMPTKSAGAATLLIYAVPLALMLAGALIGLIGEWWLQLTLAVIGLSIGLLCAHLIDRAYRKKAGVLPCVIAVVTAADGDGANDCAEPTVDAIDAVDNNIIENQPNGE